MYICIYVYVCVYIYNIPCGLSSWPTFLCCWLLVGGSQREGSMEGSSVFVIVAKNIPVYSNAAMILIYFNL